MEEQREVKVIMHDFICPKCKKGHMNLLDVTFGNKLNEPEATYLHRCDKCNHEMELERVYPYMTYE